MNEALLHTIWKYRLLAQQEFTGTRGEAIHVVAVGEHNHDSGPDFFNAKISINGILLAGNVEIHIRTSDWLRHDHQHDKAYNNLVLHVVYEHDRELQQNQEFNVSVLELKPLVNGSLIAAYHELEFSSQLIPCGKSIASVPGIRWTSWLDRLAVERLERKASYIAHVFGYSGNDLEETLYILLCRNFGFKINDEAFELLAKSLPYAILKRYADNLLRLEALLFGVAGLLDELFDDKYPKLLQNEFELLRYKHQLIPLSKEIWKFSKTRPANFPTIRLSQLAHLFFKSRSLYHLLEEYPKTKELNSFFQVETDAYWETHFKFDVTSQRAAKPLGKVAFQSIVINTVVPFLFFSFTRSGQQRLKDYAMDLLTELDAEVNKKTNLFTELGRKAGNALESQAQTELYDALCSKKACLRCNVAEFLLKASL
jgi:hypothetical protein